MNKTEKQAEVKVLKESFLKSKATYFADYKGLGADQVNLLRRKLRQSNVQVRVVKNNLARIAVREAKLGANPEKLLDSVAGPTMVVFSYGDIAVVAKEMKQFAKDNEVFTLKESLLGTQILTSSQVEELSNLPSREVLLGKLLCTLNAPVTNFVGVLAAVPRSLVQVLSAIVEKKENK